MSKYILPKIERATAGESVGGGYAEVAGYGAVGVIIDNCATPLTVKVKAKAGEDGEAQFIGFRYKPLDGETEETEVGAEGLTLAANAGAFVGVVDTDGFGHSGFDRISLELETETDGTIGTYYAFFVPNRYHGDGDNE